MQIGTGAKDFLSSGTTVSAVLSKLHFTFPEQHIDENCFFLKLFLIIFGFRLMFYSGSGANVSGRLSKLHAMSPLERFCECLS